MENAPKVTFGRHRKIMPFDPATFGILQAQSRRKAASLNSMFSAMALWPKANGQPPA